MALARSSELITQRSESVKPYTNRCLLHSGRRGGVEDDRPDALESAFVRGEALNLDRALMPKEILD